MNPIQKKQEKIDFSIRSFEKKWSLDTPNIRCKVGDKNKIKFVGDTTLLKMNELKVILGFEGLEEIKKIMWEGMKIHKYLSHEPFITTVQFVDGNLCMKKKFSPFKVYQLPEMMEKELFEILIQYGDVSVQKRVEDYRSNFVFETEETQKEMKELLSIFDCLTINWIKQIEKELRKDFDALKEQF